MKLQIDATVIYSFTEGNKKFQRSLTYEDLKGQHGLLISAETPWHAALDRMSEREQRMINSLLKKKEDLKKPPRITVSTIHGAKGGEADNVMLLTDISRKGLEEYYKKKEF